MTEYNITASMPESTVVAEYITDYKAVNQYESEAALERGFIKTLTEQGYEYINMRITSRYCAGTMVPARIFI